MESTLKSLHGIFEVKARLMDGNLGEAEVLYHPTKVTLEDIKRIVPTASGEKHNFKVVSVSEER